MLLIFAVVCVLVTSSAKTEAVAAVETGVAANVDDVVDDLDGEASRRRRMRQFRPSRRRGGYFPRWLFGG
jgi:hypothetical protein